MLDILNDPKHPEYDETRTWADDYDPLSIDELPIGYALSRIANRRNAVKTSLLNASKK